MMFALESWKVIFFMVDGDRTFWSLKIYISQTRQLIFVNGIFKRDLNMIHII